MAERHRLERSSSQAREAVSAHRRLPAVVVGKRVGQGVDGNNLPDPPGRGDDGGQPLEEYRVGGRELDRQRDAAGRRRSGLAANRLRQIRIECEYRLLLAAVPHVRATQIDLDRIDVELRKPANQFAVILDRKPGDTDPQALAGGAHAGGDFRHPRAVPIQPRIGQAERIERCAGRIVDPEGGARVALPRQRRDRAEGDLGDRSGTEPLDIVKGLAHPGRVHELQVIHRHSSSAPAGPQT